MSPGRLGLSLVRLGLPLVRLGCSPVRRVSFRPVGVFCRWIRGGVEVIHPQGSNPAALGDEGPLGPVGNFHLGGGSVPGFADSGLVSPVRRSRSPSPGQETFWTFCRPHQVGTAAIGEEPGELPRADIDMSNHTFGGIPALECRSI